MPDLEEKIAEWRKRMAAGGINTPAVLDELESHLREEIRAQLSGGASETQAFQSAVVRIGNPGSIRKEFNKIKSPACLPVILGSSIWVAMAALMLVLVLRQFFAGRLNLLLCAHLFGVTTGYLAAFLAGSFGICYVCWQRSGGLSPARERSLDRAVIWFSPICAGLVVVGLVLGMFWSRQNRGAYWLGSPREVGVAGAAVWAVASSVMLRFLQVRERMHLSIGGNMVIALAWFGAVILNYPGNNLYQVMGYWPLEIFLGIHLVFFLMASGRRFEIAKS
jgi:hypothetical protein